MNGICSAHTGRETLLQLLRLLSIFQDERVEISLAPDLELDVVRLAALLYPRSCIEEPKVIALRLAFGAMNNGLL